MHAAADADSGIAHVVGDGVAFRTARVTSVEEPEEGSPPALTVFHVEPGTLMPQSER